MLGISCDRRKPLSPEEKTILSHQPKNTFVIRDVTTFSELMGHPSIPVSGDLLDDLVHLF